MSSNTCLLIRAAQTHESVVHQSLRPEVRGWKKNLGNVGLGSGQPEGPLLSGASWEGEEACSRFVVYVGSILTEDEGQMLEAKMKCM